MANYRISMIGSGNMAGAIAFGLSVVPNDFDLCFYDINSEKAEALAVQTNGISAKTVAEAVAFADLILLAVKPQVMPTLLEEIKAEVKENQLLVSIAAGITIEDVFPKNPVIRAMPNTSAAVLKSVTGLMAGSKVEDLHKEKAAELFAAVGESLWIDEKDIHALIAVSGSGPAYFYYFVETMTKAGIELGLEPEIAERLARQTAVGAGKMLETKSESAETLRVQVTSPGGTTAAAIAVFMEEQQAVTSGAMVACANRSDEMSKS